MDSMLTHGFELDPDEEYDKFVGKVFLTTKKNVVVHCTLCESKYNGFDRYTEHIINHHFPDSTEECVEEFLEYDHENEETQSMHEEKTEATAHKSSLRESFDKRSTKAFKKSDVKIEANAIKKPLPEIVEIEIRSRPTQIVCSEKGVFLCPHCPQRFPLEYSLRAHIKEHDDDRLYKCTICEVHCKSNALLRAHIKRHEKNKPFQCTECERSFVNPSELQYHMRNHNGEKPYQCESCGVRYAYKSTLRMHHKRHHSFQKDYVCAICSRGFYSSRFLRDHMTKHTNEPSYECSKCGKKFNTSSCYGRHKAQHRKQEEAERRTSETAGEGSIALEIC